MQGTVRRTHPETMYPRLGCVPGEAGAVRITGQAVHDGPAHTAGLVDLQPQVVVGTGNGMVVLVDDEVGAGGTAGVELIQGGVGGDGEQGGRAEMG